MDTTELKQKAKATWALGDYDRLVDRLAPGAEHVVRAARIRASERVLDVACGTGNTAIKARWRGAVVTGVDLTPELLAVARRKAEAEGFTDIDFREGDVEALDFPEASFDAVVSSCGHMFAPDQERVGAEMMRVLERGGRLAFLAWTPEGGVGGMFRTMAKHVPPPPGVPSPFAWGEEARVRQLLGGAADVRFERGDCPDFAATPEELLDRYRRFYGPMVRAFGSLPAERQAALERDLLAFYRGYVTPADGTVRWGREYLIAVARKA